MNPDLPLHPVHTKYNIDKFHVFIAGSGPIGAAYARILTRNGYNVVMAEIGDQETRLPASHKKNEVIYQNDIDRFVRVIQGGLSPVSVPPASTYMAELGPSGYGTHATDEDSTIVPHGPVNPAQDMFINLPGEAVARCVGGMSAYWGCVTPEFSTDIKERPKIFEGVEKDNNEWNLLYAAAKNLIGVSDVEFEHSIRQNIVLETVKNAFQKPDRTRDSKREVLPLPLACHRIGEGSPYVRWHAADNIFYDIFDQSLWGEKTSANIRRGKFVLLTNTRCTKIHRDTSSGNPDKNVNIKLAEVTDMLVDELKGSTKERPANYAIHAKMFVLATGAVGTPQILANSLGTVTTSIPPIVALGLGVTEQPVAFCQVVLHRSIIEESKNLDQRPSWWRDAVIEHQKLYPKDPIPILFQDFGPRVWIKPNDKFPWHAQIHRDAFMYGETGPHADPRTIIDLRFFGRQASESKNALKFSDKKMDAFGMPQPTFEYMPTANYANETRDMMRDMTDVASILGAYLPGSEPRFLAPGTALHLGGTVRLGFDEQNSVADFNSQVWNFKNLYVGGNGVIPTAFASNPTLTSIALALRSACHIVDELKSVPQVPRKGHLNPTSKDYLKWLTDDTDNDFPHHDLAFWDLHKEIMSYKFHKED